MPRHQTRRRPERSSFGGELASVAAKLGQPFMPWQRDAAMVGCEIDPGTGLPAYRRVVVTVPRQQGKTTLFLSWQLDRCLSPRWSQPQRSAFTAQSGKDARDKWIDELFPLIRASPKLSPLIARIYEGMGNEFIRFRNRSVLRLLSTSSSSGHSKTLHQAVLDEIWHDTDGRREQGLGPAMLTVPDAQTLICSTAGTSASVMLNRYVKRGRAAAEADTGHGIAYIEYSAPDGWNPDDDDSYFSFMPALCPDPPCRCGGGAWRHSVTLDVIRDERDSMDEAEFARAYGNVPDLGAAAPDLLALWADRADPASSALDPVALGLSVAPDRSSAAIAACGRRADGRLHGELTSRDDVLDYRRGTAWVLGRVLEVAADHDPCVLVINPAGNGGMFETELTAAGFSTKPGPRERRLMLTGAREYAQACGGLAKDVADDAWRHLGQRELDEAAEGAGTRRLAELRAWSHAASKADITPLEAITLARAGFLAHGAQAPRKPFGMWG